MKKKMINVDGNVSLINTIPDEKVEIGGCVFTPITEKIYGKDIDDKLLSRWDDDKQGFVGMVVDNKHETIDMSKILEEILAEERSIISSPIRFDGVHVSHIKRVFEKYGIINEPKF
jgi:hypothetical protein